MQRALDALWAVHAGARTAARRQADARARRELEAPLARARAAELLEAAGRATAALPRRLGGRRGVHTEHLDHLLSEMQCRRARASGSAVVTHAELEDLVVRFTDAFNREDLDAVMAFFADDAVYDEFDGQRRVGKAAIRAAFEPQFRGDFGKHALRHRGPLRRSGLGQGPDPLAVHDRAQRRRCAAGAGSTSCTSRTAGSSRSTPTRRPSG